MSDDLVRKRLGRGLAALIGEIDRPTVNREAASRTDDKVPIEFISPNPRNPRRQFDDADLSDLARSIHTHGIVQPVVVRPSKQGAARYELIAGERRWRAAQRAGLTEVPVIIRDVDDRLALELAIIENVQRADLNPLEEASGYQQLIDDHNYTQADLGQVIGKSRSHVANMLRLLKLPDAVRELLNNGSLSAGHARTLVTASDPALLARRIIEQGLSVRQAENLMQSASQTKPENRASVGKDSDTLALERLLSDTLGLQVSVSAKAKGGEVRISYKTLNQLDDLCRRLKG